MDIQFRFLSPDQIPEIHTAFVEAFSDYSVDVSYMTRQVIEKRVVKNGIDFGLSVGAFDQEKMVGFTLVGLDNFKGFLSAFDIMTGIIKEYRGMGIAGKMFEFILPELREKGVKQFYLEVIRENDRAVKAYEKVGFGITRKLDCYETARDQLKTRFRPPNGYSIKPIIRQYLKIYAELIDWHPSWENSVNGIARIPDEVLMYGAFLGEKPVGMIIYYPSINWILGIAVMKSHRRKGIGESLVKHLVEQPLFKNDIIKIMNIDSKDTGFSSFLKKAGFEESVGQFEMSFKL